MGLLDEILKQLEEAQRQGRPDARRPRRPMPVPEREADEDGAEWEAEDETVRPGHAPHIPSRRAPEVAVVPEPPPARTTTDSRPALAPHVFAASATRVRTMLASQSAIRDALIVRELLGPPLSLRRRR